MTNLDCVIKSRDIILPNHHKGPYNQSYGISSSHVNMWELDHNEGWVLKNWCFQTVMLEKTLESPLDSKEIKPILKEINPEYSLEGRCWSWSSNTLASWFEEPTHWKRPGCWERLRAAREEGDKMRWLDDITDLMDWEIVKDREAWQSSLWGHKELDTT